MICIQVFLNNYNLKFKRCRNSRKDNAWMLPKVFIQSYNDINTWCL